MTSQQAPSQKPTPHSGLQTQKDALLETNAAQLLHKEVYLDLNPIAQKNAQLPLKTTLTEKDKERIDGLIKDFLVKAEQVSINYNFECSHSVPTMHAIRDVMEELTKNHVTESDPVLGKDIGTLKATYIKIMEHAMPDVQKAYKSRS